MVMQILQQPHKDPSAQHWPAQCEFFRFFFAFSLDLSQQQAFLLRCMS